MRDGGLTTRHRELRLETGSQLWIGITPLFFILCGWRGERKRKMNKIHAERLTLTHCLGPNLAYLANLLLTSLFIFSLRNYESDQFCWLLKQHRREVGGIKEGGGKPKEPVWEQFYSITVDYRLYTWKSPQGKEYDTGGYLLPRYRYLRKISKTKRRLNKRRLQKQPKSGANKEPLKNWGRLSRHIANRLLDPLQ